MEQKWVQAWGMSHAGMSLLGYRGNDRTFRLTVHSAVSGGQIRLSLSNRFFQRACEGRFRVCRRL
ncbi:MAG: hypothetical protein ACLTB5_01375 [Acutalibacteraceae bacterium]